MGADTGLRVQFPDEHGRELGDVLNMEARRLPPQALGFGKRGCFLSRQ